MQQKTKLLSLLILVGHLSFAVRTFAADSIAIGEEGRSGTFKSVLTVYVNEADPQPRCPSCVSFRFVYDGFEKYPPLGAPAVSLAQTSTVASCGQFGQVGTPIEFSRLMRISNSPVEPQEPVTVEVNPALCNGNQTFALQFLAKKCLNPTVPNCNETTVREVFTLDVSEILKLTPIDYVPNKK